jgi:hypothetical protein
MKRKVAVKMTITEMRIFLRLAMSKNIDPDLQLLGFAENDGRES